MNQWSYTNPKIYGKSIYEWNDDELKIIATLSILDETEYGMYYIIKRELRRRTNMRNHNERKTIHQGR
jgi:hypothetical protein